MQKFSKDAPGVLAPPPLLFLIAVMIGVAAHCLFPVPLVPQLPFRFVGATLAIVAGCIALSALAQMFKTGTSVRPDRPSTVIVTSGPYRFTRNPMYLSLCLLNLGIGLLLCDLIPVALTLALAVVLHVGVILREERYLEGKFGEVYSTYRRRVRRWV